MIPILERPEFVTSMLESTFAGIVTFDHHGVVNFANGPAQKLCDQKIRLQSSLEDCLLEIDLLYLDREEKIQWSDEPFMKAVKGFEIFRGFECRRSRADGKLMTLTMSTNPLLDQNKKFIGSMISLVDVTEIKIKTQELSTQNKKLKESVIERTSILQDMNLALGRSQTRFRTIVEQSPFGIQIFNNKGKTILLNPAWKRIFNLPESFIQDFIMKDYNVLEDPLLEKNGILDRVKKAFEGEAASIDEIFYNPRENGFDFEGKWIESFIYPLKQPDGQVREVVLIHNDVTERHESREQKNRFITSQRFLSHVTDILLSTIDFETIIERVATSSIPYFADGAVVDLVEGDKVKRVITRHIDPLVQELMGEMKQYIPSMDSPQPSGRVIKSGQPELLPYVDIDTISERTFNQAHADLIRKIGIRSHIAVPLLSQGTVIGALNFLITTDRRSFDDQDLSISVELARRAALAINNAKLYRDAKAAIQQRDDFISIASHELKTPITSLKLQQEVIIRSLGDGKVLSPEALYATKAATNSNKQLDRLTRLVEDMLDISRISTGKLQMNFKNTDLTQLLLEVLERFKPQLATQQIDLILEEVSPVVLQCDPYRLEQVITNVMSNAIRYGNKKPISISLKQIDGVMNLTFRDRGIGIAKDDQERIFQRFERAIQFDQISGLGLGLYISRQIIQDHGGELTVKSTPGMGSTFTIKLTIT